jgi:hypothetical protein
MADPYSNLNGILDPGREAIAVTPSDSTNLTDIPKALFIGTAGDISVDPVDGPGTAVIFKVPQGVFDAVRVKRVRATGTTADDIVAIY